MRRTAERTILLLAVTSLAALASGCKKSAEEKDKALPPPSGAGAAPLPALPEIKVASAQEASTTVAPTEGHTTGTTFPRAEAQVGTNASGVIEKIYVKEGDKVRKGMVLFRQDTGDAALRLAQADAALEAAKVNLRATETEYARTKAMYDAKAVNGMQWDQIVAKLDGARVQVQQAEVMRSMARKALGDATVRSPLDGVVASKLKNEGEMATMMPPTVVLVLQDQSTLELRLRLPERALSEIAVGDPVTAKFNAVGVTREAKVARIQPAVDARTRTIEVVAELPNKDGALRSGLLAEVSLPTKGSAAGKAQDAAKAENAAKDENAAKAEKGENSGPPGSPPLRAGRPAPQPESKVR
jgi:RND family efflux transporter MFP subunit